MMRRGRGFQLSLSDSDGTSEMDYRQTVLYWIEGGGKIAFEFPHLNNLRTNAVEVIS